MKSSNQIEFVMFLHFASFLFLRETLCSKKETVETFCSSFIICTLKPILIIFQ
jgi:hypothetical protein